MNQGRFPRRVTTSSLRNITTTITTIIIMPGADMGRWWSCAHVAITTIIITIITITEIAFAALENENRTLWVLFFCAA